MYIFYDITLERGRGVERLPVAKELSTKQYKVLLGVILGDSYEVIAARLTTSKSYIGNVVMQICDKLGAVDIHHAIAIAFDEELLATSDLGKIRKRRVQHLAARGKNFWDIVRITSYAPGTVRLYLSDTTTS